MTTELNRRGVLRATVWGVPVVAAAIAVPGASASTVAPVCGEQYVITDQGLFARVQNTSSATITVSFSYDANVDPLTYFVQSAPGNGVAFNPDQASSYTWPYTEYPDGQQVTYMSTSATSGTYEVTLPAGTFLDFSAASTQSDGCVESSRISIIAAPCAVGHQFTCYPF
ncbi:hypothetical protein [Pseudoclavibacter helvolus]|uniref:hypothetical protein n=1 Tax=Pseudoclavibacter helvolus TaxID=255205 RepID=UPI003C78A3BA